MPMCESPIFCRSSLPAHAHQGAHSDGIAHPLEEKSRLGCVDRMLSTPFVERKASISADMVGDGKPRSGTVALECQFLSPKVSGRVSASCPSDSAMVRTGSGVARSLASSSVMTHQGE